MNRLKNFLGNHPMRPIMNRTIIFSLFLILLSAWPVWGATYYVKTGGNDGLDGLSDTTAWATTAKVEATVTSGDTVYFRSQDTWQASGRVQVLEATAGVTYDGKTYGSGTRAKFRGMQAGAGRNRGIIGINKSNVTIRGIEVDGNNKLSDGITIGYAATAPISNILVDNIVVHDNGPVLAGYYGYGILVCSTAGTNPSIPMISNVTITNSTFYNCGGEGIAIYQSRLYTNNRTNGVLIRNCIVHDTGLSDANKFGNGILIANDSDNVTVEFNTLYNNSIGIWIRTSPIYEIEDGNGAPDNMIIRYNLIYDSYSTGISIVNPQGANKTTPLSMSGDFYGNIVINSGGNGCTIPYYKDGWDFSIGAFNWNTSVFNIYNNTFYNSVNACTNTAGVLNLGRAGEAAGWLGTPTINFKNNIVFADGNFIAIWDEKNALTHSNNLVYRSSNASHTHVTSPYLTDYNRAGVITWEATAQNTAPAFTGGTLPTGFTGTYGTNMVPKTNYFAISSGDALNNGATIGRLYNGCINGAGRASPITRPQGAAYDIGAYEYVNPNPPASPTGLRIN